MSEYARQRSQTTIPSVSRPFTPSTVKTACDSVWQSHTHARTHAHTHPFNGPLSGTTRVSRYQKCKTNMNFTDARDSEWQWHQLGHMQVCTSFQTDNHASTPLLSLLQTGCPSCRPTNRVKALKAISGCIIRLLTQSMPRQCFSSSD